MKNIFVVYLIDRLEITGLALFYVVAINQIFPQKGAQT